MPIPDQCRVVNSSWVRYLILTNQHLAVQFYDRGYVYHPDKDAPTHRGPKKHPWRALRPDICILYPATGPWMFLAGLSWPSKGKFVHAFLYKKIPYKIIKSPCPIVAPSNPVKVQQGATFNSGVAHNIIGNWGSPTVDGNWLFAAVAVWNSNGTPPTLTAPPNWILIQSQTVGGLILSTYYYPGAASQTQTGAWTSSPTGLPWCVANAEFSGVRTTSDALQKQTGSAATADTGQVTTTNAVDLEIAAFASATSQAVDFTLPTNSFSLLVDSSSVANIPEIALYYKITSSVQMSDSCQTTVSPSGPSWCASLQAF